MKAYVVRWSFKGSINQWHSGDCYSDAGTFLSKEKAEEIKNKLVSFTYEDGREKYDVYIKEIEIDSITDNFLLRTHPGELELKDEKPKRERE